MSRPRLLDLFCGAGGAAMGYHRAGFEVVGVDNRPQPRYPFEFHQGDAMTWPLEGYDAIHASPPCQAFSKTAAVRRAYRDAHYTDLLSPTRDRLTPVAVPWVIENVPGAPIRATLLLCGSMFGLRVLRHRYFEANVDLGFPPVACNHRYHPSCTKGGWLNCYNSGAFRNGTDRQYVDALGVEWATVRQGLEAIPPVYTEWIGRHLLAHLGAVDASPR